MDAGRCKCAAMDSAIEALPRASVRLLYFSSGPGRSSALRTLEGREQEVPPGVRTGQRCFRTSMGYVRHCSKHMHGCFDLYISIYTHTCTL